MAPMRRSCAPLRRCAGYATEDHRTGGCHDEAGQDHLSDAWTKQQDSQRKWLVTKHFLGILTNHDG